MTESEDPKIKKLQVNELITEKQHPISHIRIDLELRNAMLRQSFEERRRTVKSDLPIFKYRYFNNTDISFSSYLYI